MKNKRIAVRITWIGIVLLILPVIFTFVVSIIGSLRERQFLFDYLLTAELGFVVVMGLSCVVYGAYVLRETFRKILALSAVAFLSLLVLLAYPTIFSSVEYGLHDSETVMLLIVVIFYNVSFLSSAIIAIMILHKIKK